jgi:hypothetical protein
MNFNTITRVKYRFSNLHVKFYSLCLRHLFTKPVKKTITNKLFIRFIWLALTIYVAMVCGPVKRVIEQRLDNAGITCTTNASKQLKTWYREKRESAPTIHLSIHQLHDDGLMLFLASSFISIFFLSRRGIYFKNSLSPVTNIAALPLYIHFRKLQI